jgi:hypothetical protein
LGRPANGCFCTHRSVRSPPSSVASTATSGTFLRSVTASSSEFIYIGTSAVRPGAFHKHFRGLAPPAGGLPSMTKGARVLLAIGSGLDGSRQRLVLVPVVLTRPLEASNTLELDQGRPTTGQASSGRDLRPTTHEAPRRTRPRGFREAHKSAASASTSS